ncbi:hypothetical protein A2276_02795 [candidate division WOR-1 bacterium RIFOXYA12_FULL_43_27]|uniref:KilA-N DNA-binding domain-containing protein n=1 Tax=candidate division WOR-1 bacterium RIFOXYC2_FULL_46_14 TaxID=1802587 RepID=A0A1F4U811_UNCSA|nr:MAG: hypothetical protein A2276_02795 [candidate division WOR-1 bacterium RIFOXYA12_FULL_43_27]OGC19619.1 MAG: hypothetical protein A2292_01540 [candidate division WOR-1 bacterium RIFOXYB2_FULL_46_45]OGC30606.1 MAG: hypothetical protein A2232_01540 [candidate division WOR-1 bacterium RIFOXYA2_FULL_46_56]OGC41085.1 MAG: hypothetical protein A2438_01540 [candidate division WOR-1 bacterium RIFOXYC2_FULL_46_14]
MNNLIPIERAENKIYLIRGQKVMIDRDLAELYRVATFNLNKAVKRNIKRFPSDFMFQLNKEEYKNLKFQSGMSSWGGRRTLPYAFTEQGIAMLSSVLRSERAILVNIAIMRAFVRLNRILSSHVEVSKKLKELENKTLKNEKDIQVVVEVIRQLTEQKPSCIGFVAH